MLRSAAKEPLERIRRDRATAPERLKPVFADIEQHLFDRILNLNRLKQVFGVRGSSMSSLFRSASGRTPRGYIEDRRCEAAGRLLAATDLKIWQIAELVGYSGLAAFTKAFSRWAGQSPSVYRKKVRRRSGGGRADLSSGGERRSADREWLRRAVAGELPAPEAQGLIERLWRLYPALRPSRPEVRDR